MKVERIAEMRLTPADEAAIARVLKAAFGVDFGERAYYQNRHHVRLIVRDGDLIIGHMALSLRAARMGDQLVQMAGLAEVATDPDHRGKGIATAMMAEAIHEARASLADFFMLFGDQPLYAASGLVSKPNETLTIAMHGVRTGEQERRRDDGLMVMQLRETLWDDDALIDLVGFAF
jgi:predicted N-acetyltransferase YhbS